MKNLIPHFISDRFKEGIYKGKFNAVTMFLDISGFTVMTEVLSKHGREGAEVLSGILNKIFTPVIDAVYNRDGFVSGFAGDAFTAVFNTENYLSAVYSAKVIIDIFKQNSVQNTKFGKFDLSVKIGLSYGNVEWGILGDGEQHTFYFRGDGINDCAKSEHHCNPMDIVLDSKLYPLVSNDIDAHNLSESWFLLNHINKKEPTINTKEVGDIPDDVLSMFVLDKVLSSNLTGELKDITSVFLCFKELEGDDRALTNFANFLMRESNKRGGYFKGLDFGDKGMTALIVFGTPVSYEDNINRAMDFVLSIKGNVGRKVKAGITQGVVYSGMVGSYRRCSYDVLGDIVNLSARLMTEANWGKILLAEEIADVIKDEYDMKYKGAVTVKGKVGTIKTLELLKKSFNIVERFFKGEMVGRDDEVSKLKEYCKPLLNGKFGGVVYVYGVAGLGKSRLVHEVAESMKPEIVNYFTQADGMIRESMNPFMSFFNFFFAQHEAESKDEREDIFDEKFDEFIGKLENLSDTRKEPIIKELKRTKCFIKALIGIVEEGSLYEQLDPKGRYNNTMFAIKEFFKGLSLINPFILILEDIHWIDEDSIKNIQTMTRVIEDFPYIIFASGRYHDDGSVPDLKLDNKVMKNEIRLTELSEKAVSKIIKTYFGYYPDDKLFDFIVSKTENNPFFVEQFCLYLMENQFVDLSNNMFHLKEANIGIPRGINSIIAARIDRLSSELKETVQMASVLGRRFNKEVLLDMLETLKFLIEQMKSISANDFDIRAISTILDTYMVDSLLFEGENEGVWSVLSDIEYVFKHALMREAVYDSQLRSRLRNMHRIAGESIEKLYRDNEEMYEDLAYHFERAEIFDRAIMYLEKAGDYAKDTHHNENAIEQYDKLLELLTDKGKIVETLNKKGGVLNLIGRWDIAEETYRKSIAISTEIGDKKLIGESKRLLGGIVKNKGRYDEAMALFVEAKSLAEEIGDRKLDSYAVGNMGVVYDDKGDYDNAMKCYEEWKQICLEIGDRSGYSKAVGNMGIVYWNKGDYDDAMKCYEEKKQICLERGDKSGYSNAVGNMGVVYSDKGDYDNATKCFEARKQICLEIGDRSGYSIAVGNMGVVYEEKGDYDNAMKCYDEQKQICLEIGDRSGYSMAVGNMGVVYDDKGDYDNAMKCYEEQKQICLEIGDRSGYSIAVGNMGNVYAYKGDYDNAMKFCDEAIQIGRELEIKYYLCSYLNYKAKLLFDMNKSDEAKPLNNEALQIATEVGRQDTIFEATVLKHKIDKNADALLEMLGESPLTPLDKGGIDEKSVDMGDTEKVPLSKGDLGGFSEEQMATIYYELWRMTSEKEHSEKAVKLYKHLYEKTPKYEFKKKIEEMEEKSK